MVLYGLYWHLMEWHGMKQDFPTRLQFHFLAPFLHTSPSSSSSTSPPLSSHCTFLYCPAAQLFFLIQTPTRPHHLPPPPPPPAPSPPYPPPLFHLPHFRFRTTALFSSSLTTTPLPPPPPPLPPPPLGFLVRFSLSFRLLSPLLFLFLLIHSSPSPQHTLHTHSLFLFFLLSPSTTPDPPALPNAAASLSTLSPSAQSSQFGSPRRINRIDCHLRL